ncbi:hypothetical protein pb186bvf_000688 [Paramecium bursaria]
METSSLNTSHGGTTVNKEEGKMKLLLSGAYDYIHRETGKMIQKKLFKRAFQLLEKFYHQRKDLELAEMIQLNRRIIYCINKIIKQILLKPDIEQEPHEVLINIFNRGTQSILELYKYLNLFIQKVMPSEVKGVVLEDVSHLSSSSEDENEKIRPKPVTVLIYKINQYNQPNVIKPQKQKKEVTVYDQEITEQSRLAEMVQRSEKPLNIQFELDQYWYNLCELLIKGALIFKKINKPKVAYYYLIEADRIGAQIIHSTNPNLVNLSAKIKIYIANYLHEVGLYNDSLKVAEDAITIGQGEIRMRLNQEKFVSRQNKNRERKRLKKAVSTVLSAMIVMTLNYESMNNFHRMVETLNTGSWIGDKYIPGIDEFKKHMIKLAQEGRHRMDGYLKDVADLGYIANQVFDNEIQTIQRKLRHKQEYNQSEYIQRFNNEMYNLFQVKPLNKQLFFKQSFEKQAVQQNFDYKIEQDFKPQQPAQGTEMSINIFDSNSESDNSFFDASFFAPSVVNVDSKMFDEKPKSKRQRKTRKLIKPPQKELKGKSVGLIRIGIERSADYRSKILTTTNYFQQYQENINKDESPILDSGKQYIKYLENLDYRNHPESYANDKQDLDVYVNKMIQSKIDTGNIKKYDQIQKALLKVQKQEEFDKKEFQFSRKMLNLKSKEGLLQPKQNSFKGKPAIIEIDTKINNHAFITDGRILGERDLRELKRRKIDKMVAGKKIVPTQNINIALKDPEETKYLQKVLEKSKKKKLKDLIFKHKEALGLNKFFANLLREQREQEKLLKLKSLDRDYVPEDRIESPIPKPGDLQRRKTVRISDHESPTVQLIAQKTKAILKKVDPKTPSESKQQSMQQIQINPEATGTEYLLQMQAQAEAQKKRVEMIEKQQKKSHTVISMIIDGVEKKMDSENKELKKLLFKQKGGTKEYVDDDDPTYLKFMPKYTDLHRSTFLMYIKKELAEKQSFTFEDIALLRLQLNRKQNLADIAMQQISL